MLGVNVVAIARGKVRSGAAAVCAIALVGAMPLRAGDPDRDRLSARLRDDPRARAEWNAMFRRDREGRVLSENRLRALDQACQVPVDAAMASDPAGSFSRSNVGPSVRADLGFTGTAWQFLGPMPISTPPGSFNYAKASGRITALAVHPVSASVLFVGAATGGIWKSTNGGASFRPVSDTAPSLSISSIAFAASNPSILYATTGEVGLADLEYKASVSTGTYLGAGLLKSVDGGESWTRIDVNLPANAVFSRVTVHPTNPQLVVVGMYMSQDVAANKCRVGGIFQSTDGGVTFAQTFMQSVSDLAADPNTPGLLYAAFGTTQTIDPARNCDTPTAPSGVYKSADFGTTWTPALVPTTPGASFTSPTGNIRLAVGKTNPATLYASILDNKDSFLTAGLYRSTDAGATWLRRSTDPVMCPDVDAQCSYNHTLVVSPSNPSTLYLGVIGGWKSTDGGGSWAVMFDPYDGASTVHPDQQAFLVAPTSPETLFLGNDGGLYRTTDGGSSFQNLNDTLGLAQFTGIALHPTDSTFMMGGTQDNGNLRFKNSFTWTDRTYGDGGFNLIRQDDPRKILAANYYVLLNYSEDGGDTFMDVTPFDILSDPMMFYPPATAAPARPDVVFLGTNRVWASSNFGVDPGGWAARTQAAQTSGKITALDVTGDGTGPVWIGSSNGQVLFSTDGGATFALRVAGLPVSPAPASIAPIVTKIRAVSADGHSAWLTLGGFSGVPSKHVFRTADAGQSWTNVSGNLPDAPALSLAIDPSDPNGLFVGTDVGVFHSTDGGASWSSYNQGLPNVAVSELRFHPVSGDLVASTYGRGVFRVRGTGPGGGPLLPTANFTFLPSPPAPAQTLAFTDLSTGTPTSWNWDFGDGSTSTQQNPHKAFPQPGTYPVVLTVTNLAGTSAKTISVTVASGVATPVVLQIPFVLDVFGVAPTHFLADLVVVNRGTAATRLSITYFPAPGTPGAGGPTIGETIGGGRELRVPDVIAYLRANGYALPASGPTMVGTLVLKFEDVSDPTLVFAGSRSVTPNPNASVGGSFGLFSIATPAASAPSASASIFALREDGTARTNLAFVDVPGGTGPSTLTIQLFDGDTGLAASSPAPVALQANEWRQLNSVLGSVKNGWAKVTKTGGGTNRFLVYASLNDGSSSGGGTGDGSYIGPNAAAGLVPIVLRVSNGTNVFTTELILANPTTQTVTVQLLYTPSVSLGGGQTASGSLTLGPNRQMRIPDAITYLRDTLGLPLKPGSVNQGGTLLVLGATAYARTSNPNPDATVGGTFGFAYPAVPASSRAKTEAWVYGLVQNDSTRSNLAISDARAADPTPVTYVVDIFDSLFGDGTVPKKTLTVTLTGGDWFQFTKVLDGTGLSNAYVRVRPQSGSSDYVVYGVLNDGANPGERTGDGSYVAMSGVK